MNLTAIGVAARGCLDIGLIPQQTDAVDNPATHQKAKR
jgi:hypothetical protein